MHTKFERLLSKSLTTLEVMTFYLVVHTGPGPLRLKAPSYIMEEEQGKRSRERPSRRWQDDIAKKEGTTWNRKDKKTMKGTDGGLHPAVDGQRPGDDERGKVPARALVYADSSQK